jgi:hypothetical protein
MNIEDKLIIKKCFEKHVNKLRSYLIDDQKKLSWMCITADTLKMYWDEISCIKTNIDPLTNKLFNEFLILFEKQRNEMSCDEIGNSNDNDDYEDATDDEYCDLFFDMNFKTGGENVNRDYETGLLYKISKEKCVRDILKKYAFSCMQLIKMTLEPISDESKKRERCEARDTNSKFGKYTRIE